MSQNNDCLSVLCARVAAQDQEVAKLTSLVVQLQGTLKAAKEHHEKTVSIVTKMRAELGNVPDTNSVVLFDELCEHLK
jgi:hypothetical protein